jgi:hypothetical protein
VGSAPICPIKLIQDFIEVTGDYSGAGVGTSYDLSGYEHTSTSSFRSF